MCSYDIMQNSGIASNTSLFSTQIPGTVLHELLTICLHESTITQAHFCLPIIFISALLILSRKSSHLAGIQLPLTVLLFTTSQHQTVAPAPLPPTTPMPLAPTYQQMVAHVHLLYRQRLVEILEIKVLQSSSPQKFKVSNQSLSNYITYHY